MQEPIPFQIELDTLTLSGLRWGKGQHRPVLALHGWLDNCQSFSRIAPELARRCDLDIWALDLVGHGHSAHRPRGTYYHIWDNVIDLALLMDAQGWEQVDLLGHSMGAGIATLMAGAMPERVGRVALIEGLGPVSTSAEQAPDQLNRAVGRYKLQRYKTRPGYESLNAAARARMAGFAPLSFEAALALAERGTVQDELGWHWRSDPRLRIPSPVRLTEEQIYPFCAGIEAPVSLLMGAQGFLVDRPNTALRKEKVRNLQQQILPGGHHLHLEADTCNAVADALVRFWQD